MGGRWLGKVQPLGSATEDKCSVTEGLGERPDHVFIKLEAAVKHPCVCIVRWTALTNEIINVLIAAAHRLGKHLWSLRWNDVAVRRTPTSSVWLHVIRSHGFLCLKRWLWGNIKSVLWFGFVICICDCHWQKMATSPFHRPVRCSSSSYEQAVVLHSKWSLSDVRATASLWLQPRCQTIARISHYF